MLDIFASFERGAFGAEAVKNRKGTASLTVAVQ